MMKKKDVHGLLRCLAARLPFPLFIVYFILFYFILFLFIFVCCQCYYFFLPSKTPPRSIFLIPSKLSPTHAVLVEVLTAHVNQSLRWFDAALRATLHEQLQAHLHTLHVARQLTVRGRPPDALESPLLSVLVTFRARRPASSLFHHGGIKPEPGVQHFGDQLRFVPVWVQARVCPQLDPSAAPSPVKRAEPAKDAAAAAADVAPPPYDEEGRRKRRKKEGERERRRRKNGKTKDWKQTCSSFVSSGPSARS